jgi:hypothetical protein
MVQLRSGPPRPVYTGRVKATLTKDDLPAIAVSRLRASGVITTAMTSIAVTVGELDRTVGLSHMTFPNGGGWSWFVCPECQKRARKLRLTEDNRLCCGRCDGLLWACQHKLEDGRIERLRELLYGPPARLKPRWLKIDRRRRLEAALRRAIIVKRQRRLDRMKPS